MEAIFSILHEYLYGKTRSGTYAEKNYNAKICTSCVLDTLQVLASKYEILTKMRLMCRLLSWFPGSPVKPHFQLFLHRLTQLQLKSMVEQGAIKTLH